MSVIQRYEYDSLRIGDEGFTDAHFACLASFNDKHSNIYFVVGNKRIIFQNYVGVLKVGNLSIEILPKLDRQYFDKVRMQRLLISMLHRVGNLPLENADSASLARHTGGLFEIYLRLFLQEVRGLISRGIPQCYSRIQDNEKYLRGRLLIPQQIINNLVHKERFYVEYQLFSIDHKLNQILKKALTIVSSLLCEVSDDAKNLLEHFSEVKDCDFTISDFSRIHFSRNTECYKTAICIAELIITNYQPDLKYGNLNIISLLFDMNLLFERYVATEIARYVSISELDIEVNTQVSKTFWRQENSNSFKNIRPDILISTAGKKYVLDTKWKMLYDWKSNDADLKQLYAYSLQFNAEKVFLIYPNSKFSLEHSCGYFTASKAHADQSIRPIQQLKVPVLATDNGLNKDLGKAIIAHILS